MYFAIEMLIFQKRLSKAFIANEMNMSYNTFLLKMRGKYDFTLNEALKLKEILNTKEPIEVLFKRSENDF